KGLVRQAGTVCALGNQLGMPLHAAHIEKGGGRRATYPPPLPRPTPAYGRGRAGRSQPSGAPAAQRAIRATHLGEFPATPGHQCPARFAERDLWNTRAFPASVIHLSFSSFLHNGASMCVWHHSATACSTSERVMPRGFGSISSITLPEAGGGELRVGNS